MNFCQSLTEAMVSLALGEAPKAKKEPDCFL